MLPAEHEVLIHQKIVVARWDRAGVYRLRVRACV